MESQKMKILNQYDLEFKAAYDKLREKKSVINYVMNTLEGRLQVTARICGKYHNNGPG